jgi:hypothetical protein
MLKPISSNCSLCVCVWGGGGGGRVFFCVLGGGGGGVGVVGGGGGGGGGEDVFCQYVLNWDWQSIVDIATHYCHEGQGSEPRWWEQEILSFLYLSRTVLLPTQTP